MSGSKARPNIILILADQHRYDCTGFGGGGLSRTPCLDTLSRAGASFSHAFSSTPICCPARASLLSGQYAPVHQALTNYDNGEILNALAYDAPMYSRLLSDAGYLCHFVGQWHVSKDYKPTDCGFSYFKSYSDYSAWRQRQNLPPPQSHPSGWCGFDPIKPQQTRQAWLCDQAIDSLRILAASNQPFHLRYDMIEPHLPHQLPEPYVSMFDPEKLSPWPSFFDTFENKPWIQRQMPYHWRIQDWTWEEHYATVLAYYLGAVALMDAQIGRFMDALEQTGCLENTLVVFSSDHGELGGSHKMLDKHVTLYDDTARVPLFMHWPASIQSGTVYHEFVSNCVDLAPTFLDAAGLSIPQAMQGQSLLPILNGEKNQYRDSVYGSLHGSQFGSYTQRMVRDTKFKYIMNAMDVDELYDLVNDPWEMVNLAVNPSYEEILTLYRKKMIEWGERITDPLFFHPASPKHPTWLAKSLLDGSKVNHR